MFKNTKFSFSCNQWLNQRKWSVATPTLKHQFQCICSIKSQFILWTVWLRLEWKDVVHKPQMHCMQSLLCTMFIIAGTLTGYHLHWMYSAPGARLWCYILNLSITPHMYWTNINEVQEGCFNRCYTEDYDWLRNTVAIATGKINITTSVVLAMSSFLRYLKGNDRHFNSVCLCKGQLEFGPDYWTMWWANQDWDLQCCCCVRCLSAFIYISS